MAATKAVPTPRQEISFLPYNRSLIGQEEIDAVTEVLRSGWLTTGSRTREFEAAFGRYIGAANTVALNSCTAALQRPDFHLYGTAADPQQTGALLSGLRARISPTHQLQGVVL